MRAESLPYIQTIISFHLDFAVDSSSFRVSAPPFPGTWPCREVLLHRTSPHNRLSQLWVAARSSLNVFSLLASSVCVCGFVSVSCC